MTPEVSAATPCRECGGIGYYQTEGPGEGGVVLMNCHVCGDGRIIESDATLGWVMFDG